MAPKSGPKSDQKVVQKMTPKMTKNDPKKWPQNDHKMVQDGANLPQRAEKYALLKSSF